MGADNSIPTSLHLTRTAGFSVAGRWDGTALALIPRDLHPLIQAYWLHLRSTDRPALRSSYRGPEPIPFRTEDGLATLSPDGIAIGHSGNFFVTDRINHKISVYSKDFKFIRSFGKPGQGFDDGGLHYPANLVFNLDDNLIVLDATLRVQVFDSFTGEFISRLECLHLVRPMGIAICQSGNVIISDIQSHRIYVYTSEGNFIRRIGEAGREYGQLWNPVGVAVDPLNDNIVVVEAGTHRIQIFDPMGKSLRIIDRLVGGGRVFGTLQYPSGVCIDKEGNIVICDQEHHRICVVSREGEFLKCLGKEGRERNERMWKPFSVILDRDGILYVGQPYSQGVYFE